MPENWRPGELEKVKIPKTINKIAMSMIKSCWNSNPENRPKFRDLLKFINKNNFLLIDGVDEKIYDLKKHLGLD